MNEERFVGWASSKVFPAYLKMGKDENGKRPNVISLSPMTYKFAKKRAVERFNPENSRDSHLTEEFMKDSLFTMRLVSDASIADDEWKIGWAG